MLPIDVTLEGGEAYQLVYRRVPHEDGGGTAFELCPLAGGSPVWRQEFSAREGWLRGWTDGVNVPPGTAADRVFALLGLRQLAQRLPDEEAPDKDRAAGASPPW